MYHLYSRSLVSGLYWYFWYIDDQGHQIRKATGCRKKSEALAFIAHLEALEKSRSVNAGRVTFGDYTVRFFDETGPIIDRWRAHGKIVKSRTLLTHRLYLSKYLGPWFNDEFLDSITAKGLDEHLIDAKKYSKKKGEETIVVSDLSGSAKNSIKDTLTIILREALFDEKIPAVPVFKRYVRNSKRQNTLSIAELHSLFAFDPAEMKRIWYCESDDRDRTVAQMFEVMSAIAVSCGLRSGEVVALSYEQIIAGKGIVIDRELDEKHEISFPKMGTVNDPRYRVVPMSDYTFTLLDRWLDVRGSGPGFLFIYHGKPVTGGYLLIRFKRALKNAGIDTTNRRITFHGLRYTYNTRMKNAIPRQMLHDITGHRSNQMTDLYDRPILEERLDEYREQILPAVNGFWKN